jgi:hypothetical protein
MVLCDRTYRVVSVFILEGKGMTGPDFSKHFFRKYKSLK